MLPDAGAFAAAGLRAGAVAAGRGAATGAGVEVAGAAAAESRYPAEVPCWQEEL